MSATEPSSNAAVMACHHIAVCVQDIDAAQRFYSEVLGLRELARPPEVAERFRSAWFKLGAIELHVVEAPAFQPFDSPLAPHLAITTTDFATFTAQVEASGGAFLYGPMTGADGISRAILKDPTGNTIELTDAGPHYSM